MEQKPTTKKERKVKPNKQSDYWGKIIGYIKASQDCIDDHYACDGEAQGKRAEEERLVFLSNNYLLSRNPKTRHLSIFS